MELNLDYKTIQDEEKINKLRSEYITMRISEDLSLVKIEKQLNICSWCTLIIGAFLGWSIALCLLIFVFNDSFRLFTIICALLIGLPFAGVISILLYRLPILSSRERKLETSKQMFKDDFNKEIKRLTILYSKQKEFWYSLNGREFEVQIAKIFELLGYEVELSNKGADGGVDILLYKNNVTIAVQCKAYKGHKVTLPIVRDLYGVLHSKGYDRGYIVTLEGLTKPAIEFCKSNVDKQIGIITLDEIINMVSVKSGY